MVVVSAQQWDFSLPPSGNPFTNANKSFHKPLLQRWRFLYEKVIPSARENFLSLKASEYPKKNLSLGVGGNKTAFWNSDAKDDSDVAMLPRIHGKHLQLYLLTAYPANASKWHEEARCLLSAHLSQCSFI